MGKTPSLHVNTQIHAVGLALLDSLAYGSSRACALFLWVQLFLHGSRICRIALLMPIWLASLPAFMTLRATTLRTSSAAASLCYLGSDFSLCYSGHRDTEDKRFYSHSGIDP